LLKVTAIYRYPVKSMAGQSLTTTDLTENGIPGDRAWAIKDNDRGGIHGGKRFPVLMSCAARFLEDPTAQSPSKASEITFPDGSTHRTSDADINDKLSALVDASVSLWPIVPKEQLDHYRRVSDLSADREAELRAVFARTPDEPLPDLSQFPAELFEYESPPGTYFDAYPLLIMSSRALASMQASSDESIFDVRRFRPNIVVETDDKGGFPEDAWAGNVLNIGTAQLKIEMPCPRCIMTTHPFAELPKDPTIMRSLVRENGGNLGVYATVVNPGSISVGDQSSTSG
jgi:uncharacterized protein YcbX